MRLALVVASAFPRLIGADRALERAAGAPRRGALSAGGLAREP